MDRSTPRSPLPFRAIANGSNGTASPASPASPAKQFDKQNVPTAQLQEFWEMLGRVQGTGQLTVNFSGGKPRGEHNWKGFVKDLTTQEE